MLADGLDVRWGLVVWKASAELEGVQAAKGKTRVGWLSSFVVVAVVVVVVVVGRARRKYDGSHFWRERERDTWDSQFDDNVYSRFNI